MSNPYAPPEPASQPPPQTDPGHDPGQDHPSGQDHKPDQDRDPRRPGRPGRPEKPKPTPEQLAGVSRSVLHFGLFMLAAVLTMQVPLPWQLISIAFAAGALVVGIRALLRVFRQQIRGMISVLLIFGLLLSGMLLVTSLSNVAVWDEQMERQQCMRSAITVAAQDRCEQTYQQAIEERFGDLF